MIKGILYQIIIITTTTYCLIHIYLNFKKLKPREAERRTSLYNLMSYNHLLVVLWILNCMYDQTIVCNNINIYLVQQCTYYHIGIINAVTIV